MDTKAYQIYEKDKLYFPEPVISHTYTREYHLTDHLGNVRAVFTNTGIIQENAYYPFGMEINNFSHNTLADSEKNKYLYNGKEMQNDFDLDWLDYGARFYDAQIGRWHVVDPLAEKYYAWSPYNYTLGNPIKYVDPDGMDNVIYLVILQGTYDNLNQYQINSIVANANQGFKDLGLKTQVQIYEGDVSEFRSENLDDTDGYAVLGEVWSVKGFIKNQMGNEDYGKTGYSDWRGGATHPEETENGGFAIGISSNYLSSFSQEVRTDVGEAGGYLINHGAGHLAGLNHQYDTGVSFGYQDGAIMTDGNATTGFITGELRGNRRGGMQTYTNKKLTKLSDFRKASLNKTVTPHFIKRFGNNNPRINYWKGNAQPTK